MRKTKEEIQREKFAKNWNHTRKAGGPVFSGYADNPTERNGCVNLEIRIRRDARPRAKAMVAEIVLEIQGRKGYRPMKATTPASIRKIEAALVTMYANPTFSGKPAPAEWVQAAQTVLEKALLLFQSLEETKDSTLTVRLDAPDVEKIREAGKRSGLKVATKILLFALAYYLLKTSNEVPAKEDPGDEDPAPEKPARTEKAAKPAQKLAAGSKPKPALSEPL